MDNEELYHELNKNLFTGVFMLGALLLVAIATLSNDVVNEVTGYLGAFIFLSIAWGLQSDGGYNRALWKTIGIIDKKPVRNKVDRGQSYAIIVGGLMIILAAALIILLDTAYLDILSFAENTVCITSTCTTGVSNVRSAWVWFPLVVVGYFLIMVLSAAIYQSRAP